MTPTEILAQYGVTVADNPIDQTHELTGANVIFNKDAGITVTVLRKDGSPSIGSPFVVNIRPDGKGDDPQTPNGNGGVQFLFGAASAYTPPQRGPFTVTLTDSASVDDAHFVRIGRKLSPSIQGMGDFQGQHTTFQLQFRELGETTPPPPSELPVVLNDDDLRNLAYGVSGISFNPDAAMVKFARDNGMGVALSNESRYVDGAGERWAWQPFVLGIARCREGDWGNIKKVDW